MRTNGGAAAPLRVTEADFSAAETRVRPSAMREVALEVPDVSWDDVGGLDDVKQSLKVRLACLWDWQGMLSCKCDLPEWCALCAWMVRRAESCQTSQWVLGSRADGTSHFYAVANAQHPVITQLEHVVGSEMHEMPPPQRIDVQDL